MAMQNKEELKDLVMEWYLRYGEREVRGGNLSDIPLFYHNGKSVLCRSGLIEDRRRKSLGEFVFHLTPKALELIRGETANGL